MSYYRNSQLSIKTLTNLASIFAQLSLMTQTIQEYRNALAVTPYFDCIGLFRYLDRGENGYLREIDLVELVGSKWRKVVTYVFSWIDIMKVGEISRLEFATFLVSRTNLQLKQLVSNRLEHPQMAVCQLQSMNEQVSLFTSLIQSMISHQLPLIEHRTQLLKSSDYSLEGIWKVLNPHQHQFLSADELVTFLRGMGAESSREEMEQVLDVINGGKVTVKQLKWILEGFENKDKDYLTKIKKANRKCKKDSTGSRRDRSGMSRSSARSSSKRDRSSSKRGKHESKEMGLGKSKQIKKNTAEIQWHSRSPSFSRPSTALQIQYHGLLTKLYNAEQQSLEIDQALLEHQEKLELEGVIAQKEKEDLIRRKAQQALRKKEEQLRLIEEKRIKEEMERQIEIAKIRQRERVEEIMRKEELMRMEEEMIRRHQQDQLLRERMRIQDEKRLQCQEDLLKKRQELILMRQIGKLKEQTDRQSIRIRQIENSSSSFKGAFNHVKIPSHPFAHAPIALSNPNPYSRGITSHIAASSMYLADAQLLHSRIRQQRQIEREIHAKFSNGGIYASRGINGKQKNPINAIGIQKNAKNAKNNETEIVRTPMRNSAKPTMLSTAYRGT